MNTGTSGVWTVINKPKSTPTLDSTATPRTENPRTGPVHRASAAPPQRTRAIMTFLVVAAMLVAVGIGTNSAHATDGQVPFRAFYSGQALFTSETTISFDGTGIATHLGFGVNHGDISLTGPDSSCPGGLANTHVDTLTAANGDSITITAHNVACPTGFMQFNGTGNWVVTGGTGRFSDATGSGAINGNANFVTEQFTFVMSGTIAAPEA